LVTSFKTESGLKFTSFVELKRSTNLWNINSS
jgi:hypothetical protein